MKGIEFDQKFDDGVEDIDLPTARSVNEKSKLLNHDFLTPKETPEQDSKKLKPKR